MARQYRNEQVTSSPMAAMDGSIPKSVINASGTGSSNMELAPRRAGGPTDPDTPGTGSQASRRPVMIDAVTGQRLADGVNANLDAAAQHPAGDPYEMSAPEMRERFEARWSNVHLKRDALGAASREALSTQYAPLPGLVDRARSGYASPHEVGHHVAASMQNDHYLGRIFGNPAHPEGECCG